MVLMLKNFSLTLSIPEVKNNFSINLVLATLPATNLFLGKVLNQKIFKYENHTYLIRRYLKRWNLKLQKWENGDK